METHDDNSELYFVRFGSRMYAVFAETGSHAIIEVLAGIGDPDTWRGECEVWNDEYYRAKYGEPPDDVIQL